MPALLSTRHFDPKMLILTSHKIFCLQQPCAIFFQFSIQRFPILYNLLYLGVKFLIMTFNADMNYLVNDDITRQSFRHLDKFDIEAVEMRYGYQESINWKLQAIYRL